MRLRRREKVFGPGRALPLDKNAKARVEVYAKGCNAQHKQPRQHCGPLTRTYLQVLNVLLWDFHNSRDGRCYPSYEAIAAKAECARSVVAEALKALEWAGVLSWQNRIVRVRERCLDLFGHSGWRWRVIRTSNAYVFRDPQARAGGIPASQSENRTGTPNQRFIPSVRASVRDSIEAMDRAAFRNRDRQLAMLAAIAAK
jgi:hypothetical protein